MINDTGHMDRLLEQRFRVLTMPSWVRELGFGLVHTIDDDTHRCPTTLTSSVLTRLVPVVVVLPFLPHNEITMPLLLVA